MAGVGGSLVDELSRAYDVDVDDSPWCLTPRMAMRLIVQAQFTVDLARGDHGYFMNDQVLPPIAEERPTPEFLTRFHRCFEDPGVPIAISAAD